MSSTRDGLHRLACYVVAPARKAIDGRIGLVPWEAGFATPALGPQQRRVAVIGDEVVVSESGTDVGRGVITTLKAAAWLVGISLSSEPGVGSDLPPFEPEEPLKVDADEARDLGSWFALGQSVLSTFTDGEMWIWPEHFDLGAVYEQRVNLGFSPGDGFSDEPYLYVGPWSRDGLVGAYWNAPFGAYRTQSSVATVDDAVAFIREGLALLGS